MGEIIVKQGDITLEKTDAIVNPANSNGFMGGGVALVIMKRGGQEIEAQVLSQAPIPVGCAVSTAAGQLPTSYVIHAPTMKTPAMKIPLENVEKVTLAALKCAARKNITSLTFPGMGTGVGGIKKREAAETMVATIKQFFKNNSTTLKKVILIGYDAELYREFNKALK